MRKSILSVISLLMVVCLIIPLPIGTASAATDKTKPIISGAKNTTAYLGHSFNIKKGVTAKDNLDGNITSLIKITGKVDTKKLGKYTLTYKVTDTAKNTATVKRVVTVVKDKTKPKITGASNKTVYQGYSFNSKSGVKATDNADGDITSKIKITGSVNTKKTGTYKLKYTVTDISKNTQSITRVITVKKDTTKPKLTGATNKVIYKGYSFNTKTGVKASDNVDGDITNKITISGKVNTNEVGIYRIKYSVKDKTGNQISVTRTITVKKDSEKPVITGTTNKTISYTDRFEPNAGIKATDNIDGNITNKISITGKVNTRKPGTYKLTYIVKDKTGNQASVTRTITVIDNVKPAFAGYELRDRYINIGKSFELLSGITASDAIDGDLTSQIKIDGTLNTNKAGSYKLIYWVTDKAGNKETFERTIDVVDNIKPIIEGVKDETVYYLEDFDPMVGITATDNNDGDITSKIVLNEVYGKLDTSNLIYLGNTYAFEYTVTDEAGNSTKMSRKVRYTYRPVTFSGTEDITINMGEEFDLLKGVKAVDSRNGKDITSLIETIGYVYTSSPGKHTVDYVIADGYGYSRKVQRKITVIDNVPPVIEGIKDITIPQNSLLPSLSKELNIYDNVDGYISKYSVNVNTDNVDTQTEGDYIVTYKVADRAGNIAEYQSTVTVKKVPVTKLKLPEYTKDKILKIGEEFYFAAEVSPKNASFPDVTWDSSDETIARIDEYGHIIGVGEGTVTITARVDGLQESVTLSVTGMPSLHVEAWGWTPDYSTETMRVSNVDFELYNRDIETVTIDSVKVTDENNSVLESFNREKLDKMGVVSKLEPSDVLRMEIIFDSYKKPLPYNNKLTVYAKNSKGKVYEYILTF